MQCGRPNVWRLGERTRGGRAGPLACVWMLVTCALALALLPCWLLCYVAVQCSRSAWLRVLAAWHQDAGLEFIRSASVRSLTDRQRNHGILTFLVSVRGRCDRGQIRRSVHALVDRRDKLGNLQFPRLQHTLETIWGCYAWRMRNKFNLDEHLIVGPALFRGRPLADTNFQEYVSAIVAKYLPADIPPWQIVLIPSVAGVDDTHYFLLRVHHILLSEEKNLRIADFLMIKQTLGPELRPTAPPVAANPLLDVFAVPTALPQLYSQMSATCSNRWNEFVSQYDPLENPAMLKRTPPLSARLAALVIAVVSAVRECRRDLGRSVSADAHSRFRYVAAVARREASRRQLGCAALMSSALVSADPRRLLRRCLALTWWFLRTAAIRMPLHLVAELRALGDCFTAAYCSYPNTLVGFAYNYLPLCYAAAGEILYCVRVLVAAPKNILQDLLQPAKVALSAQRIKLCGRKVVSWTRKLDAGVVQRLAAETHATETEIVLAATGAAIAAFLADAGLPVPDRIPITARNVNSDYMFVTPQQASQDVGGVLCLNLPLARAWRANLAALRNHLDAARSSQPLLYLLTRMQTEHELLTKSLPSVVIKIILNYLSGIFTVALTEITAPAAVEHQPRTTVWGQAIDNIIYWKPPQANLSLSLCISSYADSITLAIMCDALLAPHHVTLGHEFTRYITRRYAETVTAATGPQPPP